MHCFNSFSVVSPTLNKLFVSELVADNTSGDNTYQSMENDSTQSTSKLPQTVAALSAAGGSFALGTE